MFAKGVVSMPQDQKTQNTGTAGKFRRRMRACTSSRTGRAVGISSLAVPLAGFILNDLRKPDSIVLGLLGSIAKQVRLLSMRSRPELDIRDRVDVIEHDEK